MRCSRRSLTLLAPAVTAALTAGPLAGAATAQTAAPVVSAAASATANPAQNVAATVNYNTPCYVTGTLTSNGCVAALTTDINAARHAEGVKALALPTDFASLNARRQLFVLTDLERVDRGLAPVAGISAALLNVAIPAAANRTDPVLPGWTVGQVSVGSWGSNWAGTPSPLLADWLWMYEDGYGGTSTFNVDCPSAGAAGCWGHRDNILNRYGNAPVLMTGIGTATNAVTQIFVGGTGPAPAYLYSWTQAKAAGADR